MVAPVLGVPSLHPPALAPHDGSSPLPRRDGEWWLVASEVSGKECRVPSSCVVKVRHR